MDMSPSKLREIVKDREAWCGAVHEVTESDSGGLVGKESACNAGVAGDTGSIPGMSSSHRERHDNPLQYPCLENLMDRGAWQATVQGVAKSQTRLK